AKAVLHPACPVSHAAKLSMIAAKKCHDTIGLSERVRLQYNRIALMERHRPISVTLKNNIIDVVGLGLNAMDTICVVPRFPAPNTKNRLSEIRIEAGGQVATALATCTRLGLKARYIGSIGSDHWGKLQLASLADEGLEHCIREVEGAS